MNIRTMLLLLLLIGIAAFAAVNWNAITAPTALSLIVTTVEAPLGVVMLGLLVLLAAIALAFAAHLKTVMLLESHSHARDMQALRKLVDQAEASRLTELQRFVETEMRKQIEHSNESHVDMVRRLDEVERNLRTTVEQGGNILAAYIGELEDRLERESGVLTPEKIR